MIDFLLAVPGRCQLILNQVNTIATNYTATVAGRIDAAISSRAAAATALSNTIWTNARAAALDVISVISANLVSALQRPTLNPPTTLTFDAGLAAATYRCLTRSKGLDQSSTANPGAGGYATAINEVGRGYINFLALVEFTPPASGTVGYRITIDANVYTGSFSSGGSQRACVAIGALLYNDSAGAGAEQPGGIAFENINFLTGFKVEFTNSVAGGGFFTYSRYRRTG